jgi:uncharacterized protein (TIGR04255 family)
VSEYNKLKKQPLKFVLAEIGYSTTLKMQEYLPDIQERLKHKYPISEKTTAQAIQVQLGGIDLKTIDNWSFTSKDKKKAFTITPERLVYFSSNYDRFDGFLENCLEIINTINDISDFQLITKIGLRYSDLIEVPESMTMSQLIDEHFLFSSDVLDFGENPQQRNESFITTKNGVMAVRTLYGFNNLIMLPDISNLPIKIDGAKNSSERVILDIDHVWHCREESISFDLKKIEQTLDQLHIESREAFWKITTEFARNKVWL